MKLTTQEYLIIRQAVEKGARNIEDIKKIVDIVIVDDEYENEIQEVIKVVHKSKIICNCLNISLYQIIEAKENGADTVGKICEITKAGTICTRCKTLIADIIEN